ncbi:MAG: hypothetical protein Q9191_003099 [Dirinaria sp. TL-2023a]
MSWSSKKMNDAQRSGEQIEALGLLMKVLECFLFSSQTSFAQLTGSITGLGNPYIITINITNPTANTISILKWNNIFDNQTLLPVSFNIIDDEGEDVQIASTYAMRSGITNNDLYNFAPGQTFSKTFDLRSYLQSIPSGPSRGGQILYQVALTSVFQGVSHSGSYVVPTDAAADLTSQAPRLGNYAAAGLGDITVAVQPLRLSSVFPIYRDVDASYASAANGAQMDTADCVAQNATIVSDALSDAGIYAHSVALAANDSNSKLYGQFFSEASRKTVQAVASTVASSVTGSGPVISNSVCGTSGCIDLANSSGAPPSQANATKNPDSYAQLAIAQWGYGQGGAPYNGDSCLPPNGVLPAVEKRDAQPVAGLRPVPRSSAAHGLASRQTDNVWEQSITLSQQCSGDALVLLQDAAANARTLAKFAQNNIHSDYWVYAFNAGPQVQQQVYDTFGIAARWNTTGNDAAIKLRCDFQRKTHFCKEGTRAFLVLPHTAYMIFCPGFFYQPLALPCAVPTQQNPTINEQGGNFLHLLLQVPHLVGRDIHDGYHTDPKWKFGACYDWRCVTWYAYNRVLPDFNPVNFPENVAANYEYFAYGVRAEQTDCSWTRYAGSFFGLNPRRKRALMASYDGISNFISKFNL